MIGINMSMPTECETCNFCTNDGECMVMGGESLWEYLPDDAPYFPNGWKCEKCPVIELGDKEAQE